MRFYATSPDGTTVFCCHLDGDDRVSVFDAATGKEKFPHTDFHTGPVWAVAVSPDGQTLATGGEDHTIRLWELAAWKAGEPLPPGRVLEGHSGPVWSLAFSPDGQLLASGGNDGAVILWDPAAGKKLRDPVGKVGQWGVIRFSPDGTALACPQEDGSVIGSGGNSPDACRESRPACGWRHCPCPPGRTFSMLPR
jgi:WD40 repeat protein